MQQSYLVRIHLFYDSTRTEECNSLSRGREVQGTGREEEKHHITLVQWGGSPPVPLSLGLPSQVIHEKVFGEKTKVVAQEAILKERMGLTYKIPPFDMPAVHTSNSSTLPYLQ